MSKVAIKLSAGNEGVGPPYDVLLVLDADTGELVGAVPYELDPDGALKGAGIERCLIAGPKVMVTAKELTRCVDNWGVRSRFGILRTGKQLCEQMGSCLSAVARRSVFKNVPEADRDVAAALFVISLNHVRGNATRPSEGVVAQVGDHVLRHDRPGTFIYERIASSSAS